MNELLDSLDWARESIDEALGNLMDASAVAGDFASQINQVKVLLNEAMGLVDEMMDDLGGVTVEAPLPRLSKFMEDEPDE